MRSQHLGSDVRPSEVKKVEDVYEMIDALMQSSVLLHFTKGEVLDRIYGELVRYYGDK